MMHLLPVPAAPYLVHTCTKECTRFFTCTVPALTLPAIPSLQALRRRSDWHSSGSGWFDGVGALQFLS